MVTPGEGPWTLCAIKWLGVDENMVLELELFGESLATLVAVIVDVLVEFMLLQMSLELSPFALKDHLALGALEICNIALRHDFLALMTSEFGLVLVWKQTEILLRRRVTSLDLKLNKKAD